MAFKNLFRSLALAALAACSTRQRGDVPSDSAYFTHDDGGSILLMHSGAEVARWLPDGGCTIHGKPDHSELCAAMQGARDK